jgi:hypothetical protein
MDGSPGTVSDPPGDSVDAGSESTTGGSNGPEMTPDVATYPTAHPRILIRGGTRTRLEGDITANTPQWQHLKSVTDQWVAGSDLWGFEAWNAAMVGSLTGQSKYCTKAIAVVDAQVTTAEAAIAAGQQPIVANDSYLDIGSLVGDVALVYDWCNSQVTSSQKTRWLKYADQAVYNVWHNTTAKWGTKSFPWTGWATNDPSDNYYYSFLRATMLLGLATLGEDSQAQGWIDQFRTTKLQDEAWPTFTSDLVGGASREGTGYGVAMRRLWELYDWWKMTTGETISTKTKHTRSSMLAFVHQVLPTLDRVVPTGDQSRDSTAMFFDYHRNYLQELAQMFYTDSLAGRVKYLLAHSTVKTMGNAFMAAYDFIYDNGNITASSLSGLNTTYFASGIGEIYSRSGWDTHATWMNLIAGPYTQSHAHQDQGSLMVYKDGWLAYDAVVDSHSGLRQETTAHGLVRISNGSTPIAQVANTVSKVYSLHTGNGWMYTAASLLPAYNGNSSITKVQREIVYLQPDVIVVYDRVNSSSATTQTWQLVSPVKPTLSGSNATFTTSTHALHVQRLEPTSGVTASAYSMTSDPSGDYASGYRLDEATAGGSRRFLHVLAVDGAVKSTSHPASGEVQLSLADGRNVTITFDTGTIGASLVINGTTYPLPVSVDTLPE